jgi:hypothetical protein
LKNVTNGNYLDAGTACQQKKTGNRRRAARLGAPKGASEVVGYARHCKPERRDEWAFSPQRHHGLQVP